MLDFGQYHNQWEDEPSWEDFFATWVDYLSKCANYYGLVVIQNKLILPEGQSKAMLTTATLKVLEAKSFLHETYPDHEGIINQLPY